VLAEIDRPLGQGIEYLYFIHEIFAFYAAQRFTLNVTRAEMARAGWSPSVRLFEAAACGTPVISDPWPGLDDLFEPGTEVLIARSTADVLACLRAGGAAARRCERRPDEGAAVAHRRPPGARSRGVRGATSRIRAPSGAHG